MPSLQTILFDLIILLIFGAAIYSFLVLPRRREFRKRQAFVAQLRPGERVTTYGGLIGTVIRVDSPNGVVTLEIAPGVEADFIAAAVMGEYDPDAVAEGARRALGEQDE
jgi:preprotein translocase subunit YajC